VTITCRGNFVQLIEEKKRLDDLGSVMGWLGMWVQSKNDMLLYEDNSLWVGVGPKNSREENSPNV
jgi:hypothetical protein